MPTVQHSTDHARFEIIIGNATAVLEYSRSGTLMTIHHTYVPVELRGQNIAGLLAKAAFDSARAEQLQVVPLVFLQILATSSQPLALAKVHELGLLRLLQELHSC